MSKYMNETIISKFKDNILHKKILPLNLNYVPYIANRYIVPTWNKNDDVILDMYSTDYYQTDYLSEPPVYQDFTLILNLDGEISEQAIKSGDMHINIGKQSIGEHWFTAQVRDKNNRLSHEIYEEFRVIDVGVYNQEIKNNTYIVTDEDLTNYQIRKDDNEENALLTKQGLQKLFDEKAASGVRKLILPKGIYQIQSEFWFKSSVTNYNPDDYTDEEKETSLQGSKNPLSIPSNFILDLNGSTIKLKESLKWQNQSLLMEINNCYDSHVINGTFEGDYRRRDLSQLSNGAPRGEGGSCFRIFNKSRYCSFENCTVKLFTGYCCTFGLNEAKTNFSKNFTNFINVDIDDNGNEYYKENKWTSDYYEVDSNIIDSKTVIVGQYLGNLWTIQSDSWNVDYHCYDENKKLIKTINGMQYREFIKPINTKYIRCTYYCKTTDDRPNPAEYLASTHLQLIDYSKPRNCDFKNLSFIDTRTCGLNPNQANNCLIEGCTFSKCATNITPVCVDFEDGWTLMQDYMFRKNEILEPVGTGDLVTDGGLNIIFEKNKNFRFGMQGNFGLGFVFKENIDTKNLAFKSNELAYHYCTIENENFSGGSVIWSDNGNKVLIARNFNFFESSPPSIPNNGYYKNCNIDFNNKIGEYSYSVISAPKGKYIECTIKNFRGFNNTRTKLYDCEYVNCNFENFDGVLNGNPSKMTNCNIKNFGISYDNYDAVLEIKNSIITNMWCNYVSYAKENLTWLIENCIIDNSTSEKGLYILQGNFNYDDSKKKIFIFKNCTFKNGTKIANEDILNNKNITWDLEGNRFE